MKVRNIVVGILLVLAGAAARAGAAPAEDQKSKGQTLRNVPPPPPPRKGDHDADDRASGSIHDILDNQRRILDMLANLQNNTLPNQSQVLANIVGLQDSILLSQTALLKEVGSFEKACTTPDLLPIPLPGGNFCDLHVSAGQPDKLHVRVINQGGGASVASTTTVLFHAAGATGGTICSTDCAEVDLPTSGLGGFGAAANFDVDVPAACYGTAHDAAGNEVCEFKIIADTFATVAETNESNNSNAGQCPRPIIIQ